MTAADGSGLAVAACFSLFCLRTRHELRHSILAIDVDAVEEEHVQVRIQIEGRAEALHEGHRAAARTKMPLPLGPAPIPAVHDAIKASRAATRSPSQASRERISKGRLSTN